MLRLSKTWSQVRGLFGQRGESSEEARLTAERRRIAAEEAQALGPINRRYMLVVGFYSTFAFVQRLFVETGEARILLCLLAGATMVTTFGLYFLYVRKSESVFRLELSSLIINLMLMANPFVYMLLHFEQPRLVYFIFLAVLYAISGVSLRVLVPSVLMCILCMIVLSIGHSGIMSKNHISMAVSGLAIAMSMSMIVRHTLFHALRARVIAERMRMEAMDLADSDALTGLPNRRSFFTSLEAALRAVKTGDGVFDLALIDLDGFKPINDIYGHSVGDALLVEVGKRLRRVCEGHGIAARMGGDEFAIILKGFASEDDVRAFGQEVCDSLRETYHLGGVTANISGSMGFVRCDKSELSASHLLERADYALYFAKQNLRGAPVVFTDKHEAEMRDFSLVDQTLRTSDLKSELSIVFQPQIDVVENRTISFEALARWNSAKLGPVRPDIFIKAAERSGLITQITILLLEKALSEVVKWPNDTRVSFNLSARDLRSGISITHICQMVMASGINPARIEFEITETAMLTDFEQACEALARIKAMGCRVAIDDFGSGYSSFSYLHRLPVDKIKIDRSFVVQLLKHSTALKIIKTIIDLCRNLNLDCVIEGVETEAEMAKLTQVRARYIQGYLFAKPMPAEAVLPYMAAETDRIQLALLQA